MRYVGPDLDELSETSLTHYFENGNAIAVDDEPVPYRPSLTPLTDWFSLTPAQQQERLRAEADRRSQLVQEPGVYAEFMESDLRRIEEAEEVMMVDGRIDTHANEVTARTLQRDVRIVGHGGGGSKGRSSKPKRPSLTGSGEMGAGRAVGGDRYIGTVVIRNVTRGQHAVFRDHPEVPAAVAEVLRAVSADVRNGAPLPLPENRPKQVIAGTKRLMLVVNDLDVARHYREPLMRGIALAILIETVTRFDAARASRLDANQLARKGLAVAA